MNSNFVVTADEHTKHELLKLGLTMINDDGTTATFINNHTISFDKNRLNCAYTDVLAI